MSEQELRELRERIAEALTEHGVLFDIAGTLPDDIIAAIEWDAVIVSQEEWTDVRLMRQGISELNDIVTEWGKG